jgi:hypothetical protein
MASAPSSSSFWRCLTLFLGFLVLVQWALFTIVLNKHPTAEPSPLRVHHDDVKLARKTTAIAPVATKDVAATSSSSSSVEGVAITIMLRAPKWFHRRYTVMLHNTLANIPDTWTVQIFGNVAWLEKDVFPLHPGLQRMLQSSNSTSRIILTPLPKDLTKQKPKQIMKSPWLWESVVAEHVLFFSGNGALCANTNSHILDFTDYDFVGIPSKQRGGSGGDGSTHSMRRKSQMLEILRDHPPTPKEQADDADWVYFTRYMLRNETRYPLAPLEVQEQFGGGGAALSGHPPFLVSGTLAHLNWTAREAFLQTCPELKLIFPSLHEPACFGAHPNGTKCKATICALRDKLPGSGC